MSGQHKNKNKNKIRKITLSAAIAALYVLATLASAMLGLSSGIIQLRLGEALGALVYFTPCAVSGMTVGCLIANLITSANLLDMVFGTLATFIGAYLGRRLRKSKWLVTLPALVSNTAIIPLVLYYGFGVREVGLPLVFLCVGLGEALSSCVLGTGLLLTLEKYNFKLEYN